MNATPTIDSPQGKRLIGILAAGGGEARFVGGCVRDVLIGRPYKDVDISTTLFPEDTLRVLKNAHIRVIPTGLAHGTVTAVVDGVSFEITTLREDVACDGRHAEVAFTDSWQADAARRDFTINAMNMDAEGAIHDYFGGRTDLRKKIVRFVGSPVLRIQEDYLRILRLFRFHAYYGGGEILPEQLQACAACAEGIRQLSGERIQMEMLKLLSAPTPLYALSAMVQTGVLSRVLPGMEGNIYLNGLEALINLPHHSNALVRLASILRGASEQTVEGIANYWRLSGEDKKHLLRVTFPECEVNGALDEHGQRHAFRLLGKAVFLDVALLAWAEEGQGAAESFEAMLELGQSWNPPKLPIRGVDLLRLGVKEGKEIGRLLKIAEDYWEANHYTPARAELLALVEAARL